MRKRHLTHNTVWTERDESQWTWAGAHTHSSGHLHFHFFLQLSTNILFDCFRIEHFDCKILMPLLVIGMTYFRTLRDDILPRNVKIVKVTERYIASGVHSVFQFDWFGCFCCLQSLDMLVAYKCECIYISAAAAAVASLSWFVQLWYFLSNSPCFPSHRWNGNRTTVVYTFFMPIRSGKCLRVFMVDGNDMTLHWYEKLQNIIASDCDVY